MFVPNMRTNFRLTAVLDTLHTRYTNRNSFGFLVDEVRDEVDAVADAVSRGRLSEAREIARVVVEDVL